MNMNKYKAISLFSGAGGMDIGFENAGINIISSQDFDKDCIKTLKANNKNAISGSIVDLIDSDLECNFLFPNNKKEELFCVFGGPPCQSFSMAGKREGVLDPRGQLFNQFVKVVEKTNPKYFVMENVKGLLSSTTMINNKEENVINIIINEFKKIGYNNIIYSVLNSADYGVAQKRERLIIIGTKDNDKKLFMPIPTHFKKHQLKNYRYQTVGDVVKGLIFNSKECMTFNDKTLKYIKKLNEGENWKQLSLKDQKDAMGEAFNSGGGKVGFFRRLSFSKPSPTILTSPCQKSTLLAHPTEDRPLSLDEYKRIQGFPDTWKLDGSLNSKYKQIGNAVPIKLAEAIANTIIAIDNNESEIK